MEDKEKEQLQKEALEAASESIADTATADSNTEVEGASSEGQPFAKKWANLFDSPEKLEQAYGHIYRAFHAKSRELQETRQALDNLVQSLSQQGGQGAPQGLPFAQPAWTEAQSAPGGMNPAVMQAVAAAQQAAQEARDLGERFLVSSVESQVNNFFKEHPELGDTAEDFEAFADEVAMVLGELDVDALQKVPQAMERAYRIIHYPEAMREARRKQEQEERDAERFEVEGSGAGSMSMPRNQSRETSFRKLVQRLKTESGL